MAALRFFWVFLFLLLAGHAQARDCLSSTQELRQTLALPGSQKAGRIFCIAPGRYTDLIYSDFVGAFLGIDPAKPVTFEAEDPDNPPVLNTWMFINGRTSDGTVRAGENGNVILRDLAFDLSDEPLVPNGQLGFRSHRIGVYLSLDAVTRNVTLERLHVTGPLTSARDGGREAERNLEGVHGGTTRNITVRDSRFEGIATAIVLGGTNLTIEGNRMRHSWSDFLRILPQVTGPNQACADTVGVTVRNNMVYDHWANSRLHPDFLQMFAASKVSCSIRDLLVEGNIAFPGEVGLMQPGFPTGFHQSVPAAAPRSLPLEGRILHRLWGPATTALPQPICPDKRVYIAVQLDRESSGPVTLVAPAGVQLIHGRTTSDTLLLDAPWETWRMMCRPDKPGDWYIVRMLAGLQGIFTNAMPGKAGYHDITIRHNIFWSIGRAMDFRDEDDSGFVVTRNSFLRNWPGDLNGDGIPNTFEDGFYESLAAAQLVVRPEMLPGVTGNVTTAPLKGAEHSNDAAMVRKDGGRSLMARYNTAPGPRLMPTTPQEAVDLARPKAGGLLDGKPLGAVARRAEDDPYDWSWVSDIPW